MTEFASVLPTKPSALLELALSDFDAVQRRSGFVIDMGSWLEIDAITKKPCMACLAGAVMIEHFAEKVEANVKEDSFHLSPSGLDISYADVNALRALSDFAFGHLGNGINRLAETVPELRAFSDAERSEFNFSDEVAENRLIHRKNLPAWRTRMGVAVDFLKSRGL